MRIGQTDGQSSYRELKLVVRPLVDEFGAEIDIDTIISVACEEVLRFDRAKVRDFVVTIAWRLARGRLTERLDRVEDSSEDLASHM